jgi:fatty acid/phospholipid biosynthesis enzyme
MHIGLDMMGGDFAPLEAVKGLQEFLSGNTWNLTIHCIGDEKLLLPLFDATTSTLPLLKSFMQKKPSATMNTLPKHFAKKHSPQ